MAIDFGSEAVLEIELTPDLIADECARLGVVFVSHEEAAARGISNLAAWAPLVGYKRYAETVVVTMRPHIIHPESWGEMDIRRFWRLIAHELVHWCRQPDSRIKLLWWVAKYGACQKFRATEEMHAHLIDLHTGRHGPDIPRLVEKIRDWYRLGRVDPEWMCDWFEKRFRSG